MRTRVRRAPGHRVVAVLAAVTAIAVLGVACGGTASKEGADPVVPENVPYVREIRSSDVPVSGGSLSFGLPGETNSWNPGLAQWASYSLTVARSIYDFLFSFDDQGNVHPYLVERADHDPEYREWTLKLRSGVTFHNGKPLTAPDVVRVQHDLAQSKVVGEAFVLVDSIDVVDDLTFRVKLNRPFANYPTAMTSQLGAVPDPEWMESGDFAHPVGTGPFMVDHWDLHRELVVRKNARYWRTDERGQHYPYLDEVRFQVIVDDTDRVQRLRSGQLDMQLQVLPSVETARLRDESRTSGEFQFFSDEKGETPEDMIVLNTAKAPFDDLDTRRALAYATDAKRFAETVAGGMAEPADSPFAPGSPWYTPVPYPAYDPVKAQEYADRVKAKHGGRFDITVTAMPSPESQRILGFLQEEWARFGITLKPDVVDQQAKIIRLVTGDFEATLLQLFDAPNPASDVLFWGRLPKQQQDLQTKDWTLDFSRLEDQTMSDAALALEATADRGKQVEAVHTMMKRMAELVPFVWLDHPPRTLVASSRVVNVVHNTLPDGATGIDFFQGSTTLHQVWFSHAAR